jgi:broad specificity phosphatase PhoE
MTLETVVHVVRHGEVYNPEGILYGRIPGFRLSTLGEQMAKVAAETLAERDVTHIVSSPLERAQQTAAPIADVFGLPVSLDERLLESLNVFEGSRVAVGDGVLGSPKSWRHLWNPFKPSWGEPYRDIAHRMYQAIVAARDEARGHEAVCVSHQLPIWTLRRCVEHKSLWHDPRHRECALASITSFRFQGDDIAEVTYAEPAARLVAESPQAKKARGA